MKRILLGDIRRRFQFFTVLYVLALIYGTLLGEQLSSGTIETALEQLFHPSVSKFNWADIAINIALYLPLGILVSASLDNRLLSDFFVFLTVVVLLFLLSSTLEIAQVWVAHRRTSILDLYCNVLGGIIGSLLYQPIKHFHTLPQTIAQHVLPSRKFYTLVLGFSLVGYAVFRAIPSLEYALKTVIQGTHFTFLLPQLVFVENTSRDSTFFVSLLTQAFLFILIGISVAVLSRSLSSGIRHVLIFVSLLLLCTAEYLHSAFGHNDVEILDLLVCFIGYLSGYYLSIHVDSRTPLCNICILLLEKNRGTTLFLILLCGLYAWLSLLPDPSALAGSRHYTNEFIRVPMLQLQQKSYSWALREIVANIAIGGGFGILLGLTAFGASNTARGASSGSARIVLPMALYFIAIEYVQCWTATRVGSLDTALLNSAGLLLGFSMARTWINRSIHVLYTHARI